jgi:tRNA (guanine-N7-)-methyltransferase
MEELLPRLRLDLGETYDRDTLFPQSIDAVWLEIGFGSGEHLLAQAEQHPEVGFIGCEPFINGMASLLGSVESRRLKNIRVHDGDARDVLAWLPDGVIGRIFILFPDPWPKLRHRKRRLMSRVTALACARVLESGGELRFASDDGDYAADSLLVLQRSGQFTWLAESAADWASRPQDWPETRYERKALSEGRKPVYLRFRRQERPPPAAMR